MPFPVKPMTVDRAQDYSSRERQLSIRMLHALDVAYARLYHRLIVTGRSPLPARGPAMLISNHTSGLDPVLIQSVCPRLITWMMAKEYYDIPSLRWIFRAVGAIPVDRKGRDVTATRAAMRVLREGGVLGIFPEGRIETSLKLLDFQTGAALMARKTGVPVYTCYLDGTQRNKEMGEVFARRQTARLTFGRSPVTAVHSASGDDSLGLATKALTDAVSALSQTPRSPGSGLMNIKPYKTNI